LVQEQGFRKAKKTIGEKYKSLRVFRDKFVSRAPVESLSDRDIPNICDTTIQKQVQEFINVHSGEKLQDVLRQFSQEAKIYSVRYFPKDQAPVKIKSVSNKYYMPGDFYRVDVWKVPLKQEKLKYEGVFVSRPKAAEPVLYGDDDDHLRKPHPAAKLVMSIYKNDIIELSQGQERELCRVAGYATTQNSIDIRPIYASETIAAWFKDTNTSLTSSFWPRDCKSQNFRSINMLFNEYLVKLVKITVDGRLFYRS
jgi:CRISPR-associated endonuclease Csn1